MKEIDVAIVAAKRTAIGNLNGTLASLPASRLGEAVIRQLLQDANLKPFEISEVIMGQVLTAGVGQNPARQAAVYAGLPIEIPSWMVNQVCGSGLKAIAMGRLAIQNGESTIVIAGGQESMSNAPHALHVRNGQKMGSMELYDTMIKDGLMDIFGNCHMGITAENIAIKFSITRAQQDEFAALSQNKAEAAQKDGRFIGQIVPIKLSINKQEVIFDKDESIRSGVTAEGIAKLKPAFKADGTVTAANASSINDGAAGVVLMSVEEAKRRNLNILGIIRSFASAGVQPEIMGTGPIPASQEALRKAGWKVQDLDLIEANEAFAAQAICVNTQMGWDLNKVNVNGGAVALGHPIGASGARVIVGLLHEMQRRKAKRGLATLCVGGGMGVAMCIENHS